jgi:Acyl-CoA carboxylase epsilon subunit
MTEPEHPRPLLRVVRGTPDDTELAALTAVVAALASAPAETPAAEPRSAWSDRAALLRRPLAHGPGAWRASAYRY